MQRSWKLNPREASTCLGLSVKAMGTNAIFRFILRLADSVIRILPKPIRENLHAYLPLAKGLIRDHLNLHTLSGVTEITVSRGVLRGARLKLDLTLNHESYWLHNYEPQMVEAIHDFCKGGMTIYDVGANIGYISLILARIVGAGGKVLAFEPLPGNIQRINEHIACNSLHSVIKVVPVAVSDREGKEIFLVHYDNKMGKLAGSRGRKTTYFDRIEVNSLRLDDFIYRDSNPPPHLIKIDVEGGGVKAIPGMQQLLSERRPVVLMELHGPEEKWVAWDMFRRLDYRVCRLETGYPEVKDPGALEWNDYIVATP